MDNNTATRYQLQSNSNNKPVKRGVRLLWVIVIALFVAAIAGTGAVFVYKTWFEQSSTSKTAQTTTPAPVSTDSNAKTLIDGLSPQLKNTKVAVSPVENGVGATVAGTKVSVSSAPRHQPKGYDFFTVPETYASVTIAAKSHDSIVDDVMTAQKYFLTKKMTLDMTNIYEDGLVSAHFHNDTAICEMNESTTPLPQGENQLVASCADYTSYAANAETLQPLYRAMTDSKLEHPTYGQGVLFTGSITDSKTNGYRIASVGTSNVYAAVGGSVALFYQTPDGAWHYLFNTQSGAQCSELNKTSDTKKAFAGVACTTPDGEISNV